MLKFYTDGASTMKKINNEWIRCNGGAAMVCINDENKIIAEYKRGLKTQQTIIANSMQST